MTKKILLVSSNKNLKWTLRKKKIQERFKLGDLLFVKKEKNEWHLKQYPKVNGGIVAIRPLFR